MALTTRRILGLGAIVAIAGLVVAGRPYRTIYDGVIPNEPYRYLDPGPGQAGQPSTASLTIKVVSGASDLLAADTSETEPQAQVFVIPGGLALPPGTTQIDVSIAAVAPPGPQPADGHVAGNVYAFTVTNQSGVPISARADAQASIELRAPDPGTSTATIERFDGTAWQPLTTTAAGANELFTAVVTQFGDFAIVLPGAAATTGAAATPSSPAASTGESIAAATPAASASGGGPANTDDRARLTIVLGAVAVGIVILVGAVALLPGRGRRPPPGRSNRGGPPPRRR